MIKMLRSLSLVCGVNIADEFLSLLAMGSSWEGMGRICYFWSGLLSLLAGEDSSWGFLSWKRGFTSACCF